MLVVHVWFAKCQRLVWSPISIPQALSSRWLQREVPGQSVTCALFDTPVFGDFNIFFPFSVFFGALWLCWPMLADCLFLCFLVLRKRCFLSVSYGLSSRVLDVFKQDWEDFRRFSSPFQLSIHHVSSQL